MSLLVEPPVRVFFGVLTVNLELGIQEYLQVDVFGWICV